MVNKELLTHNSQEQMAALFNSEADKLGERIYNTDKLASIGIMISEIAHEINNPLTGIITYAELLKMKDYGVDVEEMAKKIFDSANQCKKIAENILLLSREDSFPKSLDSVNDIIDRAIELRNYWLKLNGIEVVREYGKVQKMLVDSHRMRQTILNILLNAEQAIIASGRSDGRITVTTYCRDGKVIVKLADNGHGIPEDIVPRIFEPFYTTKPVGAGTGLGLFIVKSVIAKHGGNISVDRERREGSAFIIEVPLSVI